MTPEIFTAHWAGRLRGAKAGVLHVISGRIRSFLPAQELRSTAGRHLPGPESLMKGILPIWKTSISGTGRDVKDMKITICRLLWQSMQEAADREARQLREAGEEQRIVVYQPGGPAG